MAELSDAGDKDGGCPETSHTFIIEIDRKGSQVQERLRWKWPQSQNSSSTKGNTAVVQALLDFLDAHLLAHEPGRLAETADSSARVPLKDQPPRGYSVEVHQPALGGWWSPVSTATPSETIPKNCRVHVSVNEKLKAVPPQQSNLTPSSSAGRGTAGALPSLHPEHASNETDGEEMLALPWRRFDQDLGGGGGEGIKICGRRMVVGDVSNSSEGTGLFTWDGSVLLAKYLEHHAVSMRRDFDNQRSRRQTRPISTVSKRAESGDGVINATGGGTDSVSKRARPVVRVLELGCGTGLAGLAAAFSFGRRESGDSDSGSRAAPPCPPRRSDTCEGENHGSGERVSSPAVEDGAEIVLTDLEYALENARANINHNVSSLEAVGSTVKAAELDWCRPLPDEFAGGDSFDLILAADVVWLDELVEPLVRTLERLTAGWPSCSGSDRREKRSSPQARPVALSVPPTATQELGLGESASTAHANSFSQKCRRAVVASPPTGSPRPQSPGVGRRVLLAYQWRSQRTGDALLEELEEVFRVREIQPEECHPEYLPSRNLCLFEIVRR